MSINSTLDSDEFELILGDEIEKHLSGKHDQSTHGSDSNSTPTFSNPNKKTATLSQKNSLDAYTDFGSVAINDYAKGRINASQAEALGVSDVGQIVNDLDTLIANSPVFENETILYRGISGVAATAMRTWGAGQEINQKGFMSTSAKKNTARSFADEAPNEPWRAVMHIRVPKGSRALDVNKFYDIPTGEQEAEYLFGRNSKLLITGVEGENVFLDLVNS